METGPRFIVPSDGLEKPGIEPATPGLQGENYHCTTEASKSRFISTTCNTNCSILFVYTYVLSKVLLNAIFGI